MTNEQALREALQAVIAAHEAGMRELGELMRTSGQRTLTVRGQAAVDTLDAIEKARAALALPTAAPVDERYEVDHQVATGGGKSSPLFVVRDKTTQLAEDVFADEHPVLYGLLQARAALQSSADVRDVSKPDMFWNNDDPEKQFDSIDEMLNDLWNQGAEPEVGSVFEVQRGIRLPNIKVIVTAVDENAGEFGYEEIDAAIRARSEGGV